MIFLGFLCISKNYKNLNFIEENRSLSISESKGKEKIVENKNTKEDTLKNNANSIVIS